MQRGPDKCLGINIWFIKTINYVLNYLEIRKYSQISQIMRTISKLGNSSKNKRSNNVKNK